MAILFVLSIAGCAIGNPDPEIDASSDASPDRHPDRPDRETSEDASVLDATDARPALDATDVPPALMARDALVASDASDGSALPRPARSCAIADVAGPATLTTVPVAPRPGESMRVTAAYSVGLTNIILQLCTPDGPRTITLGGISGSAPAFNWWWNVSGLPRGITQAIVSADPSGRVYATREIVVDGATALPDSGRPDTGNPTDLCTPAAGNLLANGTFEDGMDGLAPRGWQVRNPSAPSDCNGSGTPSQHVFLTAPATGCAGRAVAIDSRGQWDCYAIQNFTPYNSIIPGRRYRIAATTRSTGNTVNPAAWFHVGVQWLTATDGVFGDEKNPRPATIAEHDHDWHVISWELVAPLDARRMVVWLSGHYPGRVDVDNVSVTLVD